MKDNKIKCGVVGVGYLGEHHVRIYKQLENCEFVGIYEINDTRAQEICRTYDCKRYDSLEAIGAACEAVSIVVPTDKHCDVALTLMKQGAHVLIEKPLCTNLKEAEAILKIAQKHNRIVQVGHVEHFNPVMNYLEQAVDAPRFIAVDRLAPFNIRGTEVGVVLDLMIHDIGILLQLVAAPIEKIEAVGVSVLSPSEDIANARITFKNGCIANLNASRVSEKKVREIRVFQSNTYLSLDFMNQAGHLIKKVNHQLLKESIPIEKKEPLRLELESFLSCIHQSLEPKVDAYLGRNALEVSMYITEQIQKSRT
jgi:predicted dehydrogenase